MILRIKVKLIIKMIIAIIVTIIIIRTRVAQGIFLHSKKVSPRHHYDET